MSHEHFTVSPDWKWYILLYFFLAGIAGGAYVIGALLRFAGGGRARGVARVAFLVAFPVIAVCPVLLTLDLGSPGRFWHMLINTTPGAGGLSFVVGSPMSVGVWALTLFAVVSLSSPSAPPAPPGPCSVTGGCFSGWSSPSASSPPCSG
jgi:formate-dependent nitrite reductase membrane component NrfD